MSPAGTDVPTGFDSDVFPAGVASFDPLTDRVLIWTLCAAPETCSWEVAADDSFADVVASGGTTDRSGLGTVVVDVTGLEPGTTYWYRFTSAGTTSPTGRTRTLPGPDAGRLRVGVTCCARYGQARFEVERALAGADVDLVVHLGDYIYEDTKADIADRQPDPPHDCVTLDDYRRRHLQSRRDPDRSLLHARHPVVAVWDDHDLADNAARDWAQGHDPDEQGPWAERLAAAVQAHHEFLPKRLADADDPSTAWRTLDAGDLVTLVCTEGRAHRDTPAGATGEAPDDDPDRTMLGAAQREWLAAAVADRRPRWALVLSGTVVSPLVIDGPDTLDALDGALPEKYSVHDGVASNTDQWDGYPGDRSLLVAALRRRGGGGVVVSGDIHSSWAIEGPPGPDGSAVAVELTCPPAATTPLGKLLPPGAGELLARTVEDRLDHVRWMDADHRGYVVLDVTRDRVDASWWWVETTGSGRPTEQLGRRWSVPHGLPARLVDPEPPRPRAASADAGSGAAGSTGPGPLRKLLLVAAAAAAVVGGVVALRSARRRAGAGGLPRPARSVLDVLG